MARELMTITEFAKAMEVTRDTIYKWIKSGDLPEGIKIKKVAGRNFVSIPSKMMAEYAIGQKGFAKNV